MFISTVLKYYKQKEIQKAIVGCALNKEVVGSFKGQGFGKRPDVLIYPNDVLELVKQGVTSFHASEELWKNPLMLKKDMKKQDVENLRSGWDLVLDIDCKILDYSNIAGYLLIEAIKHHGIKSLTCKFSGNHGYHIGVPFEAFPRMVNGVETKILFPDAPRKIAAYLKDMIKDHLAKMLIERESIEKIASRLDKNSEELKSFGKFDPFNVVDIDTILISPRHLYRMAYSLNEKSGLVSIPISPTEILNFDKNLAVAEKVKVNSYKFLDREHATMEEGRRLIIQAYDYKPKIEIDVFENKEYEIPKEAIPAEMFPPCVKLLLNGMVDGRKRAVFFLINFLRSLGWEYNNIQNMLVEWNKKNVESLREVNWKGQLKYHKMNKKSILPPNCKNPNYMIGFGMCKPDSFCRKITNPAQYAKYKAKLAAQGDRKWSDEKKEKMRLDREKRKKFKDEMKRKKERGEVCEEQQ